MQSWDQRFVAEITARITDDIEQHYANFGQGGWINAADAGATGMQAVLLHAKIAGLKLALKHVAQTHDALTGKAEKKKDAA